ncbi:MAG: NAD(P)-dependent oxidoreductase [Chloroflexi bacterium]|nr:NAD(P)-dependent oxidoreductase [Chloroflexota bacterium]
MRDTYLGDSGFLTVAHPGTIVVDMSTVDPGTSRAVAAAGAARGVRVLDAPVSGSSAGAIEGTLTIMVGGDASTLEEVRSTLAVMGPNVIHVGDNGAGSALKLVNNLIAGISMGAVAEEFALGLKAGLDPHKMFEVISKSSGNCWNLQTRAPAAGVVPTSPASNGYAPGFMTDLMWKDLGLAVSAGNELHVALPLCGLAQQWYAISSAMGHGREDFSVLGAVLQELAGLERA